MSKILIFFMTFCPGRHENNENEGTSEVALPLINIMDSKYDVKSELIWG